MTIQITKDTIMEAAVVLAFLFFVGILAGLTLNFLESADAVSGVMHDLRSMADTPRNQPKDKP